MLWKQPFDLAAINATSANTLAEQLAIEFTELGDDYLVARMPVDHRTHQPVGLLHGGASVALAETIGSVASLLCIPDIQQEVPVGVEINANHLNSVQSGYVYATCRPVKVGRRIHVWDIRIADERQRPICVSRLTIAVVERRS